MLNNSSETSSWGKWIIKFIIHPFIIFSTPVFILILIGILVYNSFEKDIYIGIRSSASVIFPIIIATFITIYQNIRIIFGSNIKPATPRIANFSK